MAQKSAERPEQGLSGHGAIQRSRRPARGLRRRQSAWSRRPLGDGVGLDERLRAEPAVQRCYVGWWRIYMDGARVSARTSRASGGTRRRVVQHGASLRRSSRRPSAFGFTCGWLTDKGTAIDSPNLLAGNMTAAHEGAIR